MKRTMTILAIALLATVAAHAQNYSITVTTNSTDLCPQARGITIATWTNNHVVALGDYIVNTNTPPRTYWAINAGTSTVMPTNGYGVATESGIEWLRFDPENRRENVVIFADISATVYYTKDGKDATTSGSILDAVRPARGFPGNHASVKGIVSSGTATVNVELDYN